MEEQKNNESGLSFQDLILLVKKNLLLIILIVALFTVAGSVYGLRFKKYSYAVTSQALVLVDGSTIISPGSTSATSSFSGAQYYTGIYSDFIKSTPVRKAVQEKLLANGYDLSMKEISQSISTNVAGNYTLVINITVTTSNKELSVLMANLVLDEAIKKLNMPNPSDPSEFEYGELANKLKVYYKAEDIDVVASRGALKVIVITFAVGIILSCLIVFVKYLLDDTFSSKEDFEKIFNINVLSVVEEISETSKGAN